MGAQMLGARTLRRAVRTTGLPVWFGWSHGKYWHVLVTHDHEHHWWNTRTHEHQPVEADRLVHLDPHCGALWNADGTRRVSSVMPPGLLPARGLVMALAQRAEAREEDRAIERQQAHDAESKALWALHVASHANPWQVVDCRWCRSRRRPVLRLIRLAHQYGQ